MHGITKVIARDEVARIGRRVAVAPPFAVHRGLGCLAPAQRSSRPRWCWSAQSRRRTWRRWAQHIDQGSTKGAIMKARLRTRIAAAIAAIGAGGTLAALAPAGPAVAEESPPFVLDVEVGSPATLLARGVAVSVPVEFTCPSNTAYEEASVSVSQRVANHIVRGYGGYVNLDCTGQPETHQVVVQVYEGGTAFLQGSALATASIYGCAADWWTCGSDSDTEEISIRH
jgi:hypothetical protein